MECHRPEVVLIVFSMSDESKTHHQVDQKCLFLRKNFIDHPAMFTLYWGFVKGKSQDHLKAIIRDTTLQRMVPPP